MSEIEKHYGHEPVAAGATPPAAGSPSPGEGVLATAKAKLDDAATTVRQTIGDAAGAAREAGGAAREGVGAARRLAGDTYARGTGWASERLDDASRNAVYARRRTAAEFNRSRRNVERFMDDNPVMLGLAGLAAGLLVGSLLPGTRRENQAFGRYADEVRDQGMRYARDLAEQGRHLVEENIHAVAEGAAQHRRERA